MFRKNWLKTAMVLLALLCAASAQAAAQGEREEKSLNCNNRWNGDRASHCVIKEQTIPAAGLISADGKKNGGVMVKGWERNNILVRAQIQTWAETDAEAQGLAEQIRVETGGANIYATGPEMRDRNGWSVSYEVFVPRNSNLSLKAHNGGISITDVRGQIEFDAHNGGASLKRLAGNVKGRTHNGGVNVELDGARWDGAGLDVSTHNGGVRLTLPENYSARLETGTNNGGLKVDFPVTVQGEIKRELAVDLGSGGAPIRVRTNNGGVTIKRKA